MKKLAFIIGILMLSGWGWMAINKPIGVTIEQAQAGFETKHPLYPVTSVGYLSWYKWLGTGERELRILGMISIVAVVILLYLAIKDKFGEDNRWVIWLVTCSLPEIYILGMNHLPEAWSLLALEWYCLEKRRIGTKPLAIIVLGLTSFTGLLGAIVVLGQQVVKKQVWAMIVMVLLLVWVGWQAQGLKSEFRTDFIQSLMPENLGTTINDEQKTLYLASEKTPVISPIIRKLAYNKIGGGLSVIIKRSGEIIDPTLWSAPLSAWVITSLSGVPTKAVWPIFYYWQILLIALALLEITVFPLILAGLLPIFVINSSNINFSAALLVIPGVYLISKTAERFVLKWKTVASVSLIVIISISWTYWILNFFGQINGTQKVDLLAYKNMYEMYKSLENKSTKFFVTNRLGPSDVMFNYYDGGELKNVSFEAFDWSSKTPGSQGVYIGFTKEYVGSDDTTNILNGKSGKVVGHIDLPSEVVHLYGKDVWAIEK